MVRGERERKGEIREKVRERREREEVEGERERGKRGER